MKKRTMFVAWLLTPLVVCVFAFLFGWAGALYGGSLRWLVLGGMFGGLFGLFAWRVLIARLKRRYAPDKPQGAVAAKSADASRAVSANTAAPMSTASSDGKNLEE